MRRNPRRVVRAPRIMSKYYRAILDLLVAQGFRCAARAGPPQQAGHASSSSSVTRSSDAKDRPYHRRRNFGPVGGRAAGERRLQGARPRGHAAGRRPLPFLFRRGDQPHHRQRQPSAALGQPQRAGRLRASRSAPRRGWSGPKRAQFPFVDLPTGQRWQLDLGDGRLPLWVFDEARRVPDTGVLRLSGTDAADLGGAEQTGRRRHPVRGNALSAAGAAAAAGGAERRSAGGLGGPCRRGRARNAAGGRTGLPAADRARRPQRGAGRARDQAAAGQGRQRRVRPRAARVRMSGGPPR